MKIDEEQVGTVCVLKPSGTLVAETAVEFSEQLTARTAIPGARVVVSLSDVPYMDSQALEGLLDVADGLASRATTLKLAATSPTCREILKLTGLTGRFQLFSDVDDAVRSFLH
jgi:anti-anti-sigma factor